MCLHNWLKVCCSFDPDCMCCFCLLQFLGVSYPSYAITRWLSTSVVVISKPETESQVFFWVYTSSTCRFLAQTYGFLTTCTLKLYNLFIQMFLWMIEVTSLRCHYDQCRVTNCAFPACLGYFRSFSTGKLACPSKCIHLGYHNMAGEVKINKNRCYLKSFIHTIRTGNYIILA